MADESAVFDNAMIWFGTGIIDWSSGQTDINALLGATGMNAACISAKNTWDTYSDITNQMTGTGYDAGGKSVGALTTVHLASNVAHFQPASTTAWTAATFDAYSAGIYHGTLAAAGANLLSYHSFSTGVQNVVSGTLTLTYAATGCFTITIAASA